MKVESERLRWVNDNQPKLRIESLQGLIDHLSHDADSDSSTMLGEQWKNAGCHRNDSESRTTQCRLRPHEYTGSYSSVPIPKITTRDKRSVGAPVILPATFGGSPRALHESYLDAMALVARFGRPDFFVTMTANPNWCEIVNNLKPGESAVNRPELVARVFRCKLRKLLNLSM